MRDLAYSLGAPSSVTPARRGARPAAGRIARGPARRAYRAAGAAPAAGAHRGAAGEHERAQRRVPCEHRARALAGDASWLRSMALRHCAAGGALVRNELRGRRAAPKPSQCSRLECGSLPWRTVADGGPVSTRAKVRSGSGLGALIPGTAWPPLREMPAGARWRVRDSGRAGPTVREGAGGPIPS